jgi:hypothetical protein
MAKTKEEKKNKRTVTICIDEDIVEVFKRMKEASINRSAFICNLLRLADDRGFVLADFNSVAEVEEVESDEKPESAI